MQRSLRLTAVLAAVLVLGGLANAVQASELAAAPSGAERSTRDTGEYSLWSWLVEFWSPSSPDSSKASIAGSEEEEGGSSDPETGDPNLRSHSLVLSGSPD